MVAVVVDLVYVPEMVDSFRNIALPAEVTAADKAAPFKRVLNGTINPDADA